MTEPNQTWYATTGVAAPERPALTHDLDVDVCVIGWCSKRMPPRFCSHWTPWYGFSR